MRKSNKLNRQAKKLMPDGSIEEEAPGADLGDGIENRQDDDESSVDSLMAESPSKYDRKNKEGAQGDKLQAGGDTAEFKMINEDELIKRVTKKKIPKKKPPKVHPFP